jgi:tRNA(Ile)-lysidine synthetase-like protein
MIDDFVANINHSVKESLSFLSSSGSLSRPSLLVAVSGGVDSMVLLDILCDENSLGVNLVGVIHVDHSLREESESDAEVVKKTAKEKGLPFYFKKIVPDTMSGLELWGREERYNFFSEIVQATGSDCVVTGHHLDDEIETFLFRLITGRSLAHEEGLIRAYDASRKVLRPFLRVTKKDIIGYAKSKELPFVEDRSNLDITYSRNFIRHKVLPLLEEMNPSVRRSLDACIEIFEQNEVFLNEQASLYASRDPLLLEEVPDALRCRVLRILAEKDVGFAAFTISDRRYEALLGMLLSQPSEKKRIDMGQKTTAVIDKNLRSTLHLRFEFRNM